MLTLGNRNRNVNWIYTVHFSYEYVQTSFTTEGWGQMSACKGASCSRCQSVHNLSTNKTQKTKQCKQTGHNTGLIYISYSFRRLSSRPHREGIDQWPNVTRQSCDHENWDKTFSTASIILPVVLKPDLPLSSLRPYQVGWPGFSCKF